LEWGLSGVVRERPLRLPRLGRRASRTSPDATELQPQMQPRVALGGGYTPSGPTSFMPGAAATAGNRPRSQIVGDCMDEGLAAVLAAATGVVGALAGSFLGGRAALTAARIAHESEHELRHLDARRASYAGLGRAAWGFNRKCADIIQIIARRYSPGSIPGEVRVPPDEWSALDRALDDVGEAASYVQLNGPDEIVPLAADLYRKCMRVERALSWYNLATRSGQKKYRARVDAAFNESSKARGVFLGNGRAHLDGVAIPLRGEPTRLLDWEADSANADSELESPAGGDT
jgi:hypothetical protein